MTAPELSELELSILCHALGASRWMPREKRGYRNRYIANRHDSRTMGALRELELLGLMVRRPDTGAELLSFNATEAGCRAAGLDDEQTRRALRP